MKVPKLDVAIKWISSNMDRSISILNKSIGELQLHRIKGQTTDKENQLLKYQAMATDLKETFIRVIYRIEELKTEIELDKEDL